MQDKLVKIALAQVGIREVGGNNCGKQIRIYQEATTLEPGAWPWCAAFTCWLFREWLKDQEVIDWLSLKTASVAQWRPKTASAFAFMDWARARQKTVAMYSDTATAMPGDLVVFDFSHIGLVIKDNGKTIETVEGNALPLTSKILTPGGFKLMKDIQVGDKIIDPEGEESFVTGVFPKGERDVYKVELQDKSESIACGEHLWKIYIDGKKGDRVIDTLALKNIIDNQTISPRLPLIKPVDFEPSGELPIDPYLLGLLLGDGGMSRDYLGFTNQDEQILEYVRTHLPEGHRLKDHIENENKVEGNYRIIGDEKGKNKLLQELNNLGLQGKRSFEKSIPDIYKKASIEDRLSLLQGLMDTDGTIDKIGRIEFSSSSKQLSEDVLEIIRSLGGRCSLNVKTDVFYTSPKQKTKKAARDAYRLQNINMPFFNLFKLERHAKRFKFRNAAWARKVVSVEPAGREEVQCISVSAKSKLFITNDYMPTHNTNGKGERDSKSGDGVWYKTRAKSLAQKFIRVHPSK